MRNSSSFPAALLRLRLDSDPRLASALLGLLTGTGAGLLALLLIVGGPILAFGAVCGLAVGLYVLTNLMAGLYLTILILALLPFATLPVRFALTPTFLDFAIVGFMLVYVFQWMTGRRTRLQLVPAHALIAVFMLFTLFSFVAGLGHAQLTTSVLRKFAELLLSILLAALLVDVVRDVPTLRRIVLAIIVLASVQAVVGLALYAMNEAAAERLLNALSRFGYPSGQVIRYVEENPELAERAIGTWVDPNAYGGFLLMAGALAGAQVLAAQPVTGERWLAALLAAPIGGALLLTQSRGAFLALGFAVFFVAALRHRWLLIVMALGGVIFFVAPFTASYRDRLLEGLGGEDLATQMRFGEYKDAFILIGRYPVIGVGFAGAPDRDIYLGVSSMYLKIAGATGLVGLSLFLLTIAEVFRYGLRRWARLKPMPWLSDVWLGLAAGLAGAMVSGVVDHYYFNIEFQGAVTMFWLFVGLSLAAARLAARTGLEPASDT